MKSLAIWYGGTKELVKIELHVNFWKLPIKGGSFRKSCDRFLDLGIKIDQFKDVKEVYIYIPFEIKTADILDLGKIITASDSGLLSAIFNEPYKITNDSNSDYSVVTDKDESEKFIIHHLNESISSELKYGGTIIKIQLPKTPKITMNVEKTYIRFRVKTKKLEGFSTIEKNPTSVINYAFTKFEIFDFRINSLRHLPNKLNEKIEEGKNFTISKIHFFYICSYKENYILSHTPFSGARKLEDNIWDEYISTKKSDDSFSKDETFVAYHWKEKTGNGKEIKHFNALIKTEFRDNNWNSIVKYMIFLVLFTVLTGVFSNVLYNAEIMIRIQGWF